MYIVPIGTVDLHGTAVHVQLYIYTAVPVPRYFNTSTVQPRPQHFTVRIYKRNAAIVTRNPQTLNYAVGKSAPLRFN